MAMQRKITLDKQGGMMLVEGMIAILIFSLGILAIIGTQAIAIKQTSDAKFRVDASFLANQSIGAMWTDKEDLDSHEVTDEEVSALPNGKRTIEVTGSQVTVTITWQLPNEEIVRSFSTVAQING
jgi:type IV pilus assembly protein PilV